LLSCALLLAVSAPSPAQQPPDSTDPQHTQTTAQPRCQIAGEREITITCDYTSLPMKSTPAPDESQIALNRAELSFKTKDDNWMRIVLRFTKLDGVPISEPRPVYIAVDDDAGHNFIRRPLPGVNFASLTQGQPAEFLERLRMPALRPGHYQIKLWIPSAEPALKFNAAHNFLLSSVGVGDEASKLNAIAAFSVAR
jgi:hypothetical protein